MGYWYNSAGMNAMEFDIDARGGSALLAASLGKVKSLSR